MSVSAVQPTSVKQPESAPQKAANSHGFSFHDLLSVLNPLQYLPVVGTIYRAATGDVIPDAVRYSGSMIVSGLLGGPVGMLSNVAVTLGEKATGIDPEKIVTALFHKASPDASTAQSSTTATPATPTPASPTPLATSAAPTPASPTPLATPAAPSNPLALSPQQLAAYGVHQDRSGTLHMGDIQGADVLNAIEQARLDKAASAYAANQTTTQAAATRGS